MSDEASEPDEDLDEHYEDAEEEAMENCSWDGIAGHSCMGIGSEDCDWDCPFTDDMWRGLRQHRDAKGRFAKHIQQEQ